MIGDEKVVIPTTIKELEEEHCTRIKSEVQCVNEFKPCLKLFPRTIFNMIMQNVKSRVIKNLCDTESGKKEFIKHMSCFDPTNIVILHQIVNNLTVIVDHVATKSSDELIIPSLCCGYFKIQEDGLRILNNLCSNRTGADTAKFAMSLMRSVVADAVDLGCGRYSSKKSCDQYLPEVMKTLGEITDPQPNEPFAMRPYTAIIPMLTVADRLDDINVKETR